MMEPTPSPTVSLAPDGSAANRLQMMNQQLQGGMPGPGMPGAIQGGMPGTIQGGMPAGMLQQSPQHSPQQQAMIQQQQQAALQQQQQQRMLAMRQQQQAAMGGGMPSSPVHPQVMHSRL